MLNRLLFDVKYCDYCDADADQVFIRQVFFDIEVKIACRQCARVKMLK